MGGIDDLLIILDFLIANVVSNVVPTESERIAIREALARLKKRQANQQPF